MRGTRQKTLAHMQRMLTMGTAVTAAFACGKTHGTEQARGCGKAGPSLPDANLSTTSGSSGYAVVDPVPPPAHCPGSAASIVAKASLVKARKNDAGAALAVVLVLEPPTSPGQPDFHFVNDAPAYVYGGTVVSHMVVRDGKATTIVAIPPGTTNATISVKATCSMGPTTIMAGLTIPPNAKAGDTVAVSVNEY